jgi:hypothetical protein
MGSIPHGTTINAEALEPTTTIAGPPTIPAVDITPFNAGGKIPFASQTATNTGTPRLPPDLTKFIAAGTITQAILSDPNTVLRNAIKGQKITKTVVFTVSTAPSAPELGGGTANIGFLLGAPTDGGPNAQAVNMTATFWIETVQHTILVTVFTPGQPPIKIAPPAGLAHLTPTFVVQPTTAVTLPRTITVTSTQIQYSQTVFLNFAGLTWPHVSVATLVPSQTAAVPWN